MNRIGEVTNILEELNYGYSLENHSIDRVLLTYVLNYNKLKDYIPEISEVLNDKYRDNILLSKIVTDKILSSTFGVETPNFSNRQDYLIQNSESEYLRTIARFSYEKLEGNLYDLSERAIKNIYRHKKGDKRVYRRHHNNINSKIWIPDQSIITPLKSSPEDISKLEFVRLSQKLNFFAKFIDRYGRILQPSLEDLIKVYNTEDEFSENSSNNSIKISINEIENNFNKFSKRYTDDSMATLMSALKEAKDLGEVLESTTFCEYNIPPTYRFKKYRDNLVRSTIGDLGRSTIIMDPETIEIFDEMILEDLENNNSLVRNKLKCEDNRDSNEKDGGITYSFRGIFDEGTSCEVRVLDLISAIEASLGIRSHELSDRKKREILNQKRKQRNSGISELDFILEDLIRYYILRFEK